MMDEIVAHKDAPTVLTDIPRYPAPQVHGEVAFERSRIPALNIVLFLLTLLTTTIAGAIAIGEEVPILHPFLAIAALRSGLSFSLPLMAILLAHEMGHYLTARYHGVPTSLPYFIPAPPIFITGTFGAFIRMKAMPRTRRVMFDIGAAGPWAGVIVAIPALIIGLRLSDVTPLDKSAGGGIELGSSLLFLGLTHLVLGADPSMVNVNLHPIALAGWFGLLVTSLNLLPVGQLDGGHVVYALFPRRHRTIAALFVISCILMLVVPLALGRNPWWGWLIWAVLLVALGLGHPSTVDRDTPLDPGRAIAAWLTVLLFIVTFSPVPLSIGQPEPPMPRNPDEHTQEIIHHAPHYDQMFRHLPGVRI